MSEPTVNPNLEQDLEVICAKTGRDLRQVLDKLVAGDATEASLVLKVKREGDQLVCKGTVSYVLTQRPNNAILGHKEPITINTTRPVESDRQDDQSPSTHNRPPPQR
jgi:hypothetical protein